MKKDRFWWILFPAVTIALLLIFYSGQQPVKTYPKPTEINLQQREDKAFKQDRKAFIEQMHKAAPGTDWRQIDQQTRQTKAEVRMSRLQSQYLQRGANPLFSRDTLANNQVQAHWREIGSRNQSGRIHTAAYDQQADILYLASSGGNIWKGSRNGSDWQVQNDLFQIKGIEMLELVDLPSGQRLFANATGWGQDGFWYSDDQGQTWTASQGLSNVKSWGRVLRSVIKPDATHTIYLLAFEWDNTNWEKMTTLYRSVDNGLSFGQIATFSSATFGNEQGFDIWTDPLTAGPVYLLHDNDLYELDANDQPVLKSSVIGQSDLGNAHLVGSGNMIYAGYHSSDSLKVYQSSNAGQSWSYRGQQATNLFFRTSFNVDRNNPQRLYAGGINAFTSDNGGASWRLINQWWEYYGDEATKLHADIPSFPSFETANGIPFSMVCTDGGAFISYDELDNVSNISLNGLNVSQYYSTYTFQIDPAIIYVGSQDQGFQRSKIDDGGVLSFDQLISGDYGHLGSANGGLSLWCNYPGFTMYYPSANLGTNNITLDFPTDNHLWLAPLMVDPLIPNIAYLGGGGINGNGTHIVKLTAGINSISYQQLPYDFPGGGSISAMAISPLNHNFWYVITDNANYFFSLDGGNTWNATNHANLPGSQYFYGNKILPSPTQLGRIYLAGSGYNNSPAYVSNDNGQTFTAIDNGLPNTLVYGLACTPDESMVFAATEVGPYLYLPADDTWYPIEGMGAPDQTYWSVEYVEELRAARFGTYGRGIWDFVICDSLSELSADFSYQKGGADGLRFNFQNQSSGAYFYQWNFGDGSTSTEPSPTHTYAASGVYELELIVSNHCFVDTIKETVNLFATDIESEITTAWNVYPNPSKGQLSIEAPWPNADLRVLDLQGRLVWQAKNHPLDQRISLKQLSSGIYLLELSHQGQTDTRKIIIE
ncbi:MAG: T9SS type A sorting domain-containing protein [Bacteroidota bacterium]